MHYTTQRETLVSKINLLKQLNKTATAQHSQALTLQNSALLQHYERELAELDRLNPPREEKQAVSILKRFIKRLCE